MRPPTAISILLFLLTLHSTIHTNGTSLSDDDDPFPHSSSGSTKVINSVGDGRAVGGFWISIDLMSAEFRKGCISTALCYQPRLKLINAMTLTSEESVMSWPASADLVQDHARSFVTYWQEGDPEDVSISCQIAGTDPSFGFSRICDETPQKRVFNEALIQQALVGDLNALSSFHPIHSFRKHMKRCPWCPDPNVDIVVRGADGLLGGGGGAEGNDPLHQRLFLHNVIIVVLSGAAVLALIGLCFSLSIHYRYRQRHPRRKSVVLGSGGNSSSSNQSSSSSSSGGGKKRLLKFAPLPSEQRQCERHVLYPPPQRSVPPTPPAMHKVYEELTTSNSRRNGLRIEGHYVDEHRYETPWEATRMYRPLPHWMGSAPPGEQHYQQCPMEPQEGGGGLTSHPHSHSITPYETSGSSIACSSARSFGGTHGEAHGNTHCGSLSTRSNGDVNGQHHPQVVMRPASACPKLPPANTTMMMAGRHEDSGLESV